MNDAFGRQITITTDNGTDRYVVSEVGNVVLTISVPTGTPASVVMNTINANAPATFSQQTTHLAPYDFLKLFTDTEKMAITNSADPIVKEAIINLTAIITSVDLGDQQTASLVGYLASIGLISSDRVQQILSGTPHN